MGRKKQETEELYFLAVPEKDHYDYFRILVHNCIVAYSKLFNDKLALDYNKITGKTRAMVLADIEYQRETRSIYSKRMLEEIGEIERLVEMADGMDDDGGSDIDSIDPRNKGKRRGKKKVTTADKDVLNMQFRALQARREMLNLSADNERAAETDALNHMFVALTAQEFERIKQVEINAGTDDNTDSTFGSSDGASKEAPSGEELKGKVVIDELYTTDANGDIVEL
jgi:hypothetical protein